MPATGSHTEVHKKERPKRRIAGQALVASTPTSASSSSGIRRASVVSTPRYSRSARFVPRSARQRGSGAATGSIGTVVMGRNVSSLCHETVTPGQKQTPPAGAYRRTGGSGSRMEGYRAAVVQTDLPPAVIVFKRVSIHGRNCLGSGA